MRLLLDTHIAIWAVAEPERLGETLADRMTADGTECWVSVASLWEITIKASLGRTGIGAMPFDAQEALALFEQALACSAYLPGTSSLALPCRPSTGIHSTGC